MDGDGSADAVGNANGGRAALPPLNKKLMRSNAETSKEPLTASEAYEPPRDAFDVLFLFLFLLHLQAANNFSNFWLIFKTCQDLKEASIA